MAMRMSGMISGMDTESLISQLVEAKSSKLNKTKKTQIKANWKQDAWKDLNTKLKNLQSKYIGNLRFASSYSKKTTKVSDSSKASVITGEGAVNSVQSLEIGQLAKTGYLTGAELKNGDSKAEYTALTKLGDMKLDGSKADSANFTGTGTFSIKTGNTRVDVTVDENTTISDVLNKFKDAGLNASFDSKTQRFFISSKESGLKNDFSITASDESGDAALAALGLKVSLKDDKATLAQYEAYEKYDKGNKEDTIAAMKDLIDASVESRRKSYLSQYQTAQDRLASANKAIDTLTEKYVDKGGIDGLDTAENYQTQIDAKKEEIENLKKQKEAEDSPLTDEEKAAIDERIEALDKEVSDLSELKADVTSYNSQKETATKLETQIAEIEPYLTDIEFSEVDGKIVYTAKASAKLQEEEEENFYEKATYAKQVMDDYRAGKTSSVGATKVSGQDAIIKLNGAEFTNTTNVFDINGLTITALAETKEGESVTLTTENDTDGIYDMIKGFLKEYNAVINEMDKLYNADSAKGYEPLLSEEKEAMSETEVTEYEKKIKDALLRSDNNLSTISNGIRGIMSDGFTVNGKKMYLTDFGINTLGYFNAPENERNAYHIDGDADDDNTSGNADKLKSLISSEPDTVISFFTQMAQSLYSKMSDMSRSVDGYRSFGSFYDDKKMTSEYKDYTTKISDLEQKLNDYEDKWYSKFAKMESAMAKMQSKTTALAGLIGGS